MLIERGQEVVSAITASWKVENFVHIVQHVGQGELVQPFSDASDWQTFHAVFSQPTQRKPAPIAAIVVLFQVALRSESPEDLFVLFSVEGEDLIYFVRTPLNNHVTEFDYGFDKNAFRPASFERLLEKALVKKMDIRQLHNLELEFEETRLEGISPRKPSNDEQTDGDYDSDAESWEVSPQTSPTIQVTSVGTSVPKPIPVKIGTLLANIFDAADEDNANSLMHREVASLLFATLNSYGLAPWDIHLLMKEAQENEVGNIAYQPFVISAPELVESLAARRSAFTEKWAPYLEANPEASDGNGGINLVTVDAVEVT
jgi:hypothetical protein